MANKRDSLLVGFVGDGKVRIAREGRIDFDEIGAVLSLLLHRFPALGGIRNRD
jgi:hypothetical protein